MTSDYDFNRDDWIEPTEEERERLYVFAEECAELAAECHQAMKLAMKTLRFGFSDYYTPADATNRKRLAQEMGDVVAVINMMRSKGDVDGEEVESSIVRKMTKLDRFMSRQRSDDDNTSLSEKGVQ